MYILPLFLLVLGFTLASALGWKESAGVILGFAGLALGALIVVLSQRWRGDKNKITFTIVERL